MSIRNCMKLDRKSVFGSRVEVIMQSLYSAQ